MTPIDLSATPARSILKSANKKSERKSIKIVLFDKSDDSDSTVNNEQTYIRNTNTDTVDAANVLNESSETKKSSKENLIDIVEYTDDISNNNDKSDVKSTNKDKENRRKSKEKKKPKLIRQDAKDVDTPSPVKTRKQRMSLRTPLLDISSESSSDKRILNTDQIPRRSTRSRKSMPR